MKCFALLFLVVLPGIAHAQTIVGNPTSSQTIAQPAGTVFGVNRFENVRYADHFSGVDIGAKINSAYADCPSAGCRIKVPAGQYSMATSIQCSTLSKPCLIEGDPGGAVTLTYTGSGAAVTLDWGYTTPSGSGTNFFTAGGVRDVNLSGPGHTSLTVGILFGPTHGLNQAVISGVGVTAFGVGVESENTSFQNTIENSSITECETGLSFPAGSGGSEETRVSNSEISRNDNGINIANSSVELSLIGNSLDDNDNYSADASHFAIVMVPSTIFGFGNHFENIGGKPSNYISNGGGNVTLHGGQMLEDRSTGSSTQMVISAGGALVMDGVVVWSSGATISQVATLSNSASASLKILNSAPARILSDYNLAFAGGKIVDQPLQNSGSPTSFRIVGNLIVNGSITGTTKSFTIDHPLDPAKKNLTFTSVESPDMLTIFNGTSTTDRNGLSTITLPSYFEALNGDYRYQLTVLGRFAQAVVAREIRNNTFKIRTSRPNVKVSWQVTGIRHDAYANAHRTKVETDKPKEERGNHFLPEVREKE